MGGEIEKKALQNQNHDMPTIEKEPNKKQKEMNRRGSQSSIKGNSENKSHHKRNNTKKKKKNDKMAIVAKDKDSNQEKKVLKLIHDKNPDKEDYELLYNKISKHFFLQTLNHQAKDEIIISMSLYSIKAGETLYKEGSQGNFWYIVNSGELNKLNNNKLISTLNRGDSFGEKSIMNGTPRSTSVVAVTDCKLWVLKRSIFKKILEFIFTSNYEQNMMFLEGLNMPLDATSKSIMANNLIQEIYLKGQYICKEGEIGNCMYIVKDGEIECLKGDKVIRTLKTGDNFGQKAILEEGLRSLDVRAKTDCKIYSISIEFFKNQFGENFRQQLYFNFISQAFMDSNAFKEINSKMKNNELVYPKGQSISEKLCVVLEGNIVDKKINRIEAKRNEILYESLLSQGNTGPIKHNLTAEPDCILAEIDYEKSFPYIK